MFRLPLMSPYGNHDLAWGSGRTVAEIQDRLRGEQLLAAVAVTRARQAEIFAAFDAPTEVLPIVDAEIVDAEIVDEAPALRTLPLRRVEMMALAMGGAR